MYYFHGWMCVMKESVEKMTYVPSFFLNSYLLLMSDSFPGCFFSPSFFFPNNGIMSLRKKLSTEICMSLSSHLCICKAFLIQHFSHCITWRHNMEGEFAYVIKKINNIVSCHYVIIRVWDQSYLYNLQCVFSI